MPGRPGPPIERFYRHVRKSGECLLWTSTKAGMPGYQYGTFRATSRATDKKPYAHIWIWEYHNGPAPDGWQIDHIKARGCVGYLCVRLDHLEAVPVLENQRRKRLSVCRSGKHDLNDLRNVNWDKQGRRRGCAQCKRDSELARHRAVSKG